MFIQMKTKVAVLIVFMLCLTAIASNPALGSSLLGPKSIELNQNDELKLKLNGRQQTTIRFKLDQQVRKIELDIASSASFQACVLNLEGQCSNGFQKYNKKQVSLNFGRLQLAKGIKIRNSYEEKKIKVKISFHSEDQQCHKLESKVLHRQLLKHHNCFLFEINKMEDFEIVAVKEKNLDLDFEFLICDQKFDVSPQNIKNNKFLLKFTEIIKVCKAASNRTLKLTINHAEQENNTDYKNHSFIGLILQNVHQSILLPDGIAYASTHPEFYSPKRFEYQLLNKYNTTINVISQSSLQIYVKVVEQSDKDKTQPSKSNCDFSSKSGFIFTYFRPYLILSQKDLQKFRCVNCYLVVSVHVSSNLAQIGKKSDFSIQITQFMSTLVSGQMKQHFLQAGAMAFYSFTAYSDNVVVYQLADNNKHCNVFYLSEQQVPGPQNYIKKSDKNRIIYKSESKKEYFIGVKAEKDCAYFISATISSSELIKLEKGRFGYLNMAKNQTKYFLIQAETCQYIKLLSLHVYGSVQIYINKTDSQAIKKFNKNSVNYSTFAKKGQYLNRLLLRNNETLFCEGCYYIVAVVSKKLTESTLFYGDENTPIPISEKVINDMIPFKGSKVTGEYQGEDQFELQVKIHTGRLKITIIKGSQTFTSIYEQINEMSVNVVDLGGSGSFFEKLVEALYTQPIKVEFQALKSNTIYSTRFKQIQEKRMKNEAKQSSSAKAKQAKTKIQKYQISPGHDLNLAISSQNSLQISGYFRDSSQKLLLSTEIDQSDQLNKLNLTLTAGSKQIQYALDKMSNIITLSVPKLKNYAIKQGIKYHLAIESNDSTTFWFTIMQTEDFQLLSPEVYTNVKDQYTFVTHTQGELIVELFQCRGKSNLVYASQREKLDQNQSMPLDIVGLSNQPHAFRVNCQSTNFYKVNVKQGVLRWFIFNLEQGIGTGYIDYAVGSLHYETGIAGIKIIWQSLARKNAKNKQSANTIASISYTLYIASNYQDLSQNSQCEPFLAQKRPQAMKFENLIGPDLSMHIQTTFSYNLKQKQILDKYGQNATLYATIVAELFLTVNTSQKQNKKERYRFIYPQIQLPNEVLQLSYVSTVIESDYHQLVSAILFVAAAIVISTYLLTTKLLPILGRLKNRFFVEENQQQISSPIQNVITNQNQNQEVPQSSDRRGIASTGEAFVCDENK